MSWLWGCRAICTCISYRSDTKSNYTTDESEISVKTTCVCRCGFWRQMNDDKISSVWHICIWVFLCVNFVPCFSCELLCCAQCVNGQVIHCHWILLTVEYYAPNTPPMNWKTIYSLTLWVVSFSIFIHCKSTGFSDWDKLGTLQRSSLK